MSSPDESGAGSERRRLVIAIDGPAAAGKSSTAQWVASVLGFRHVDSGSLYRAATAAMLRRNANPEQWTAADVIAAGDAVQLLPTSGSFAPVLGGESLAEVIRQSEVTKQVSRVAKMREVREWVNQRVRALAEGHDVVVDGRDMGTAVFPDAQLKVFLVADPWERARRRLLQSLNRRPTDAEIAEETDRLVQRDAHDATQTVQAKDAVLVDTTYLSQPEQVERIVALARAVTQRASGTSDVDAAPTQP